MARVDHALIGAWLRARSVAYGLPAPVEDHGGWRVDTARPDELRRHVFARPAEGLRQLAQAIVLPKVYLKLCAGEDDMRPLLPPRWHFAERRHVMLADRWRDARPLPPGYALRLTRTGIVTLAQVVTGAGAVAASGHAVELGGVYIYDRIGTAPGHRRRGLAAGVMQALRAARRSTATEILVATEQGRALYAALGWLDVSPYSTAFIPD